MKISIVKFTRCEDELLAKISTFILFNKIVKKYLHILAFDYLCESLLLFAQNEKIENIRAIAFIS